MIIVYLFTAALFLAGLKRFSVEEKLAMLPEDGDRISSYGLVAEKVSVYDDSIAVFSYSPGFTSSCLPLSEGQITSSFGYRTDPFGSANVFHSGTDIAVPINSEVYAVGSGTVIYAGYDDIGGNSIRISHGNGFESYYGHLSEICVSVGDEVAEGEIIGKSGESGKVTGAHLHLGLFYNDVPIDPEVYLNLKKYSPISER